MSATVAHNSVEQGICNALGWRSYGHKLVAVFTKKIWIGQSQFREEGNLVLDALTRPVTAGKKLQVAQVIESSVSVDVVDRLVGEEFSPKMTLHNPSVFSDLFGPLLRCGGNPKSDIAVIVYPPHRRAGRLWTFLFKSIDKRKPLKLPAAPIATGVSSLSAVAGKCEFSAAHCAIFDASVRPAYVRALTGAIKRILAKRLSILAQFSKLSFKRVAARFAFKFDGLNDVRLTPSSGKIGSVAFRRAKFSASFDLLRRQSDLNSAFGAGNLLSRSVASLREEDGIATADRAKSAVNVASRKAELGSAVLAGAMGRIKAFVVSSHFLSRLGVALFRAKQSVLFLLRNGERRAASFAREGKAHVISCFVGITTREYYHTSRCVATTANANGVL